MGSQLSTQKENYRMHLVSEGVEMHHIRQERMETSQNITELE